MVQNLMRQNAPTYEAGKTTLKHSTKFSYSFLSTMTQKMKHSLKQEIDLQWPKSLLQYDCIIFLLGKEIQALHTILQEVENHSLCDLYEIEYHFQHWVPGKTGKISTPFLR